MYKLQKGERVVKGEIAWYEYFIQDVVIICRLAGSNKILMKRNENVFQEQKHDLLSKCVSPNEAIFHDTELQFESRVVFFLNR